MAYAIAVGGADCEAVKVRDIRSSKDLTDEVQWVRFSNT